MTFQVERWHPFYRDACMIFPQHWKELAVLQDKYRNSIDELRYEALEDKGVLLIVTARDGQKLAGYIISFLMPHMHYKDAGVMALTDMYYVLPEYRNGTGAALFRFWEGELRERGIVQAMTSCKRHQDHERFLAILGFEWTDKTFVKYLEPVCQ